MRAFCRRIAKVELHAHLHGCVRDETLRELARGLEQKDQEWPEPGRRTLEDCFHLFGLIHRTITTRERVQRVIREAVEDFVADNVVYVELRTTPRSLEDGTESDYVDLLVDEVRRCMKEHDNAITVRLLLSVNRAESVDKAWRTLELAETHRDLIVGLDFSGNPTVGSFLDFLPVFEEAKARALGTTLHFAEVFQRDQADLLAMVSLEPDRLGHACCLTDELREALDARPNITLEICPTSNLMTRPELHSYADHPFEHLDKTHRCAICTDDPGVFATSSSAELAHLAEAFSLDEAKLLALVRDAAEAVLATPEDRERVLARIRG